MTAIRAAAVGVLVAAGLAVGLVWMLALRPAPAPDTVAVNDLARSVAAAWPDVSHGRAAAYDTHGLPHTVVDASGRVIAGDARPPITDDLDAVARRASSLPVQVGDREVGRLYVADPQEAAWSDTLRTQAWWVTGIVAVLALALLAALAYVEMRVTRPFQRLRSFAATVASGDLGTPLPMDRAHSFGAFTEAFDLMRTELARAQQAEAAAQESKRDLVAELGHDIRTPLAAIAAAAEVLELSESDPERLERVRRISSRTDQLEALVGDLFEANDDELERLGVTVQEVSSHDLARAITDADDAGVVTPFTLPDALVDADPWRWRQVVDNVLTNSAKYAGTPVTVTSEVADPMLVITLADAGPGVADDELEAVTARGVRGSNVGRTPGLGLGLHTASTLMTRMGGGLELRDSRPGLAVVLALPLAGRAGPASTGILS